MPFWPFGINGVLREPLFLVVAPGSVAQCLVQEATLCPTPPTPPQPHFPDASVDSQQDPFGEEWVCEGIDEVEAGEP